MSDKCANMKSLHHSPEQMRAYMKEAIEEARAGLNEGGIPIGSILVRGEEIIGRGHNLRVQENNPTAHAEIVCFKNAGRQKTYSDTVLYSTLMPCAMCAGASIQFGVPLVIAGENRTFESSKAHMEANSIKVVDMDLDECYELLEQFRIKRPDIWNEDIGIDS